MLIWSQSYSTFWGNCNLRFWNMDVADLWTSILIFERTTIFLPGFGYFPEERFNSFCRWESWNSSTGLVGLFSGIRGWGAAFRRYIWCNGWEIRERCQTNQTGISIFHGNGWHGGWAKVACRQNLAPIFYVWGSYFHRGGAFTGNLGPHAPNFANSLGPRNLKMPKKWGPPWPTLHTIHCHEI